MDLKRLIEENKADIANLRQEIMRKSDGADEADQAFEQEARLLAISKIKKCEEYQRRLRVALRKQELGEFGYCEDCGIEIDAKRLETVPDAPCCIDCQSIREHKGYAA